MTDRPVTADAQTVRERIGWIVNRTQKDDEVDQWKREAVAALERLEALLEGCKRSLGNTYQRLARCEEALREIVQQDPVELALDPQWPQRIARAALGGMPAPRDEEDS